MHDSTQQVPESNYSANSFSDACCLELWNHDRLNQLHCTLSRVFLINCSTYVDLLVTDPVCPMMCCVCVPVCVACVCGMCAVRVACLCVCVHANEHLRVQYMERHEVRMCRAVKSVVPLHSMMDQHLISIFLLLHLIPAQLYTHKLCLRVYLNGDGSGRGTHVSFFITLMKGEFDPLLPRPFKCLFFSAWLQAVPVCHLNGDICTHYCSSCVIM